MRLVFVIFAILLNQCHFCLGLNGNSVVEVESIYPTSFTPSHLIVVNESCHNADESLLVQSMQGIINRDGANYGWMIYRVCGSSYSTFLSFASSLSPSMSMTIYSSCEDQSIQKLLLTLSHILPALTDSLYYAVSSSSSSSSSSSVLAGLTLSSLHLPKPALLAPYNNDLLDALKNAGYSMIDNCDTRTDADNFNINSNEDNDDDDDDACTLTNTGDLNQNLIILQKPSSAFTALADYAIYTRARVFYNSSLYDRAFSLYQPGSMVVGWGDSEFDSVLTMTKYGMAINAADWACSLSVLANLPSSFSFPSSSSSSSSSTLSSSLSSFSSPSIRDIVNLDANIIVNASDEADAKDDDDDNFHTVCFLLTDGDNVQWLLNDFSTSPAWYGSLNRSRHPEIGFTMSPAVQQLAPVFWSYMQATKGETQFVAAPSGVGYFFPDHLPVDDRSEGKDVLFNRTNTLMQKTNMQVLNVIADQRNNDVIDKYMTMPGISGMFYYPFSNNYCVDGSISWSNNKPVVTGRLPLWGGVSTPSSVASVINSQVLNRRSVDGYTLIPVHVWTYGIDDVVDCINQLHSNVRVLPPNDFVNQIKTYVPVANG